LPYTVTSDNGSHFVAEAFETFLKDKEIKHRKTTPLWPQANGGLNVRKTGHFLKECRLHKWKEKIGKRQ